MNRATLAGYMDTLFCDLYRGSISNGQESWMLGRADGVNGFVPKNSRGLLIPVVIMCGEVTSAAASAVDIETIVYINGTSTVLITAAHDCQTADHHTVKVEETQNMVTPSDFVIVRFRLSNATACTVQNNNVFVGGRWV